MIPLRAYFILCPLLFLAGFVDAVAGGGGLISLPAYLLVGIPVHMAAGTNKVVNGIGTGAATISYLRSGKVRVRAALWAALGALIGAFFGVRLALLLSEALLQGCILAVLPIVAVILAVNKDFASQDGRKQTGAPPREAALSLLIGIGIGLYDGMIGPGTGTFMIMAFTLILGIDLLTASGCAKVANLASNVTSAVVWMVSGKVLWQVVAPGAACSILGNWCGSRYAIRGGSQRVRGMIFVVLGLLFAKMAYDLLHHFGGI